MTDFRPRGFQVLPIVVKNLIIINVLFVLAQFAIGAMGIDLADYLGLHYWRSEHFGFWQIITHMFMHGSYNDVNLTFMHIFSNMFALWMFGSTLENRWGPKKFITFYLICGIGAALCHLAVLGYQYETINNAFMAYQQNATVDQFQLFTQKYIPVETKGLAMFKQAWLQNPSSMQFANESKAILHQYLYGFTDYSTGKHLEGLFDEATVGASGAVFGVLFAFGYLFPNTLLYLYFFVPVKAKWFIGAYALFELYAGVNNTAGDNVAHFAHLGGMLFAFILLKIWQRRDRRHYY
jgi:membrane associated rhomboid family serine protease